MEGRIGGMAELGRAAKMAAMKKGGQMKEGWQEGQQGEKKKGVAGLLGGTEKKGFFGKMLGGIGGALGAFKLFAKS